jgi:hypothetical protein
MALRYALALFFGIVSHDARGGVNARYESEPFKYPGGQIIAQQVDHVVDHGEGNDILVSINILGNFNGAKRPEMVGSITVCQTTVALAKNGSFPKVLAVRQDGALLEVLISHGDYVSEGEYLATKRDQNGSHAKINELSLGAIFPKHGMTNYRLKEVSLTGRGTIRFEHQDGFVTEVLVNAANQVFINGRSCAPGDQPITRINYLHFLHALSPGTVKSMDMAGFEPRSILWWAKDFPAPPYTYEVFMKLAGLVNFKTYPPVIPETVPEAMRNLKPKAAALKRPKAGNYSPSTASQESAKRESSNSILWIIGGVIVLGMAGLAYRLKRGRR